MENKPVWKKKDLGKIKLWILKNDKIKKAVKDQVKEITATSMLVLCLSICLLEVLKLMKK